VLHHISRSFDIQKFSRGSLKSGADDLVFEDGFIVGMIRNENEHTRLSSVFGHIHGLE
jgi:hypothetical protein